MFGHKKQVSLPYGEKLTVAKLISMLQEMPPEAEPYVFYFGFDGEEDTNEELSPDSVTLEEGGRVRIGSF